MAAGESPCEIPSSVPGVLACGLHRIDPSWCDRPVPFLARRDASQLATAVRSAAAAEWSPTTAQPQQRLWLQSPTDLRSSHCSASSASLPSPSLPPLLSSPSQASSPASSPETLPRLLAAALPAVSSPVV